MLSTKNITIGSLLLLMTAISSSTALAFPNRGANCTSCHDSIRTDRMQVTPQALQIDLGTQLDGSVNGPLNTFTVDPGNTVLLSMDILNGSGKWSAVLKQFEKGGQELSQSNILAWSQSGNAGWTSYSGGTPYLATTEREDTGSQSLTFSLTVDANTPPDTYELVFAIAGKSSGMYAQEEAFYLEVAGAAPTTWAGYEFDELGNLNTEAWLGWLNITYSPWVYVYDLSSYVYLPEEDVLSGGSWVYFPK